MKKNFTICMYAIGYGISSIWKLGIRNEELGMKEVETGKWVK